MNGRARLEYWFPKLSSSIYKISSKATEDYNCIAWAAEDDSRWWWPDADCHWPDGVPRQETLEAFIQAYQTLGYEPCNGDHLESGFQKIAIYVDNNRKPTHAARQLPDGKWTSKLGKSEDIEHVLDALTGSDRGEYGFVGQIMKRPSRS